MTWREVIDTILFYCGQSTGGNFETKVKILGNRVYFRVLNSGFIPHEHRIFTLATVASTSKYGLPLYVKKVLNIEDPTTPRFVYETTARYFDKIYPGTTESSTPSMAFPLGVRGVEKFPAADGTLTIVSSSTADSGANYKTRVTGFNASGVLVTELVTASGTTAVATSNSYDSTLGVERIVKTPASGYTFAGNLTVKDSSSNTIAVIPVWFDSPEYQWIQFHPIPNAVITYNIRCEMKRSPLINDTDWPEFDPDYHDLIVFGVTKDLLPSVGKASAGDRHRESFKTLMREFATTQRSRPNAIMTFSDVQSSALASNRPTRPLIAGVDFGQAS